MNVYRKNIVIRGESCESEEKEREREGEGERVQAQAHEGVFDENL